jgi:hypothetical protein
MKFSGSLKIKTFISALMFLIFFGYIKVLVMNSSLNTEQIILNTILFIIWLGLSYIITF